MIEIPWEKYESIVADKFDPPLDPGIRNEVLILRAVGIETYQSCEGGEGHSFSEPTVQFHGSRYKGFMALTQAMENGLAVKDLRRVWSIEDGEPVGPNWEMTFYRRVT